MGDLLPSLLKSDVIFVSVPGLRGDVAIVKREQDKTIREAIKAIEAGATILVDNKAYTFDSKNTYNTGEKRLFQNLEAKGYNYSEITIGGVKIGTWSKSRTTQPKQGPQPGEQLDLFNQLSINPNQKFDKELAKKIQDKLEKLYPEIKLNISNTPVWEEGNNVLNQEQYNNK